MKSILKGTTGLHSDDHSKTKLVFDNDSFMSLNYLSVNSKAVKNNGEDVREYDFDKEVPELYRSIQNNNWTNCSRLAESNPEQAGCWIFRRETNGNLRWRLLPLHAAIIFKAPENVIRELLDAHPRAAKGVDDQGMLPLHLAFRYGSEVSIVNNLLVAYPMGISVKDKKGRVPLVVAQESNNQNKRAFRWFLERAPLYYAAAIVVVEKENVMEEHNKIFDIKMKKKESEFQVQIAEARNLTQKQEAINETLKLSIQESKKMCSELRESCVSLQRRLNAKLHSETYVKQLSSEKDKYYLEYKKEKERAIKLQMKVDEMGRAIKENQFKSNTSIALSKDYDPHHREISKHFQFNTCMHDVNINRHDLHLNSISKDVSNDMVLIQTDTFLKSRGTKEKLNTAFDSRCENEELRD